MSFDFGCNVAGAAGQRRRRRRALRRRGGRPGARPQVGDPRWCLVRLSAHNVNPCVPKPLPLPEPKLGRHACNWNLLLSLSCRPHAAYLGHSREACAWDKGPTSLVHATHALPWMWWSVHAPHAVAEVTRGPENVGRMRAHSYGGAGAVWDIWPRGARGALKRYLRAHAAEFRAEGVAVGDAILDPIHDQARASAQAFPAPRCLAHLGAMHACCLIPWCLPLMASPAPPALRIQCRPWHACCLLVVPATIVCMRRSGARLQCLQNLQQCNAQTWRLRHVVRLLLLRLCGTSLTGLLCHPSLTGLLCRSCARLGTDIHALLLRDRCST